jgi:septum site-determining protein MinC
LDDKNSQDRAISVTKSEVEDVSVSLETPVETLALGLTVDRPVRSGQQVYAKNGDLIVLSQTSAGSEVMADGSIHVYGPLRGRVLAGVKGDKTARIFCRSLEAELIVIAGCYQLLDESKTDLKGKPAMIRLEDEKLIIESLD